MPWRVAAAALVGYGLFTGGLFMGQRHLMYHPGSDRPDLALAAVDGFQEVILTTADGLDLVSWYRPAEDGRQTIVVTHGNAGHIGHRAGKLAAFTDAGYGMLLIGYRGFGGNPGKPNEDGLYLDAEAGFAFLETQGVTPDQVIAYGESLGTAVAVEMAARYPLAAVILEAPFISIANVAASHYWYVPMAQLLVLDKFDAGKRIGDVSAPILMLHGARDSIVPTRMGQELFEVANQPKQFWLAPEADHGDLYDHGAAETALEFLDEHL
jgi:hypothetical protein